VKPETKNLKPKTEAFEIKLYGEVVPFADLQKVCQFGIPTKTTAKSKRQRRKSSNKFGRWRCGRRLCDVLRTTPLCKGKQR